MRNNYPAAVRTCILFPRGGKLIALLAISLRKASVDEGFRCIQGGLSSHSRRGDRTVEGRQRCANPNSESKLLK